MEESRVRYNDSISINLAKGVFFARKGHRVEVDEKKVFNFSTISPSLGDPFHRITTLNDDRAVLLIIHGGAGRVAVTGLKGGRRRSDKKSSRSGGGLRRGNSRVGDDFRGATR